MELSLPHISRVMEVWRVSLLLIDAYWNNLKSHLIYLKCKYVYPKCKNVIYMFPIFNHYKNKDNLKQDCINQCCQNETCQAAGIYRSRCINARCRSQSCLPDFLPDSGTENAEFVFLLRPGSCLLYLFNHFPSHLENYRHCLFSYSHITIW